MLELDRQPEPQLSPFLRGNYAPVSDELDTGELPVTGTIPEALAGAFMRNGPNPAFPPLGRYHLFDGDGMIHAVELAGGRARYRNRFVESRGLLAERRAGRALFGGLSEFVMPDPELASEVGLFKNTANTNVIRHAGRYLALMEGCPPTEITRDLRTIGEFDFDGRLVGAMTAHPKWDPLTGELLFFGYSPVPPFLRYHVADATGCLVRSIELDLPAPVMMHDFVVTERFAVFFDLPAVFDLSAMTSGGPFVRWEPSNGARIGILPREATSGDEIRWFEIEPCYVFHFLNAWDDGTVVTVDGCRAPRLPIAFGDEQLDEPAHPVLHRWTVDLDRGVVTDEQLDDRAGEFPRLNMHRSGMPNRYGYLAASANWETDTVRFNGVVKYDLRSGRTTVHDFGEHAESGEAVFAADPEGSAEDDGWLLTFVYDRRNDTSDLVILDARALDEEPVARVHIPRRVPFGFHGNWMPDRGEA
ncbi:MAG: carotenoid oxygenase family protein [Acidimicrobiales bacterium]